jgi:hypothetical protein
MVSLVRLRQNLTLYERSVPIGQSPYPLRLTLLRMIYLEGRHIIVDYVKIEYSLLMGASDEGEAKVGLSRESPFTIVEQSWPGRTIFRENPQVVHSIHIRIR